MLGEINVSLLQTLNDLGNIPLIAQGVGIFADGPILLIPIFLVSMWIYAVSKNSTSLKEKLMYIFYGCVIGITFSLLIQQVVHVDRPEQHLSGTGKLLLQHLPTASFPSDHATIGFAFAIGLYLFGFNTSFYFFLPIITLMCLSRVIAGVHWPFDILAGMGVGSFASYVSYKYVSKNKFVKKFNSFIIKVLQYIKL